MSDNAKHYDHFKVEGPAVKTLVEGFKAIDAKRQAIIAGLQAEFDAVAHTNSYGFGDKGSRVCNLVWPADHEFPCQTTIKHRTYFKDAPVVIARGKGNTKEGREFNKQLDAAIAKANSALADLHHQPLRHHAYRLRYRYVQRHSHAEHLRRPLPWAR